MRHRIGLVLFASALLPAQRPDIETTIRDLYSASQAAMREAKSKDDVPRMLSTFAPEWVGNMPARETLTFADLRKEAEMGVAIPPEKRPIPKLDFVYIRQNGWSVLAVYWISRQSGRQIVGSLYRDTWAYTAEGWRRIRQEKFFPDRALIEDGKPVILPSVNPPQ